jgi:spermidine synthase
VNDDAFVWLDRTASGGSTYDVIVVDFPDPSNHAIGKLYSTSFYALLANRLAASGYAVIQTTSPLIARKSFWTVAATVEAVGLTATPYHAHVPSFGEWGFIVASHRPLAKEAMAERLPAGLRFLQPAGLAALFDFPADMARVEAEPNRLSTQGLVHTFEQEWGKARE